MRLNRFLASAGLGSRRKCEEFISGGKVCVNGKKATLLATQVGEKDCVTVNGKAIRVEQSWTAMLHKPKGVICSTVRQGERRRTVYDLLPKGTPRVFCVGRLDLDSSGLLLMTNSGDLAYRLTHPKYELEKVYHVRLDRDFDGKLIKKLKKGFRIEPGFARCKEIKPLGKGSREWEVTLTQGLNRQIRLMFRTLGYKVVELKRVKMGKLTLGTLRSGDWKELKKKELGYYFGEGSEKKSKD